MFIDGLPIWGFIGKVEKLPSKEGEEEREKLSLFTHVSGQPSLPARDETSCPLAAQGSSEPCVVKACATAALE